MPYLDAFLDGFTPDFVNGALFGCFFTSVLLIIKVSYSGRLGRKGE